MVKQPRATTIIMRTYPYDILEQATAKFETETGLDAKIEARDQNDKQDAVIHMAGQRMAVEIKPRLLGNLGVLMDRVHTMVQPALVCTEYVNPVQAEKLKVANVQFMDTAGNAFINQPPLYVFIKGNKPDAQVGGLKEEVNRAFEPTGLKVIYAFLTRPEMITAPYREIAQYTGVALGTVGWVINGLKDAGFLVDVRGREARELVNKKRLIDRWVEAYIAKLRPKLLVGLFLADTPEWWHRTPIEAHGVWMGGELAAAKIIGALRPEQTILYLPEHAERDFLLTARLRRVRGLPSPNTTGLISIYRPFWLDADPLGPVGCVHPVLVYADLVATADPRNLEVARQLYEEHIY